MSVWVSSTGLDWSIKAVSASRLLRASIASVVVPLTSRDSSGPSPPTAVYDSSITVLRLSCGIACRPRLVASSSELMSGGTEVRSDGDDVAVFQRRAVAAARQQLDVLLADRRLAVHLGVEIGRDVDIRIQRQHRLDAGVGQAHVVRPGRLRSPGR